MGGYKPIAGWEDYAVSRAAVVKSKKSGKWVRLRPGVASNGYPTVCLSRGKPAERRSFCLHALVLTTFVGPCPPGQVCRHLDGNKRNNNLSNLAWGTRAENSEDSRKHGTMAVGEARGGRLTSDSVLEIRVRYENGEVQTALAKEFGVHQVTISEIVTRKIWRHI